MSRALNKTRTKRTFNWRALCCVFAVYICASAPIAQAQQLSDLTPEQQQLLNQLPPAQRQELIDRYRQATTVAPPAATSPTTGGDIRLPMPDEPEEEPARFEFDVGDTLIVTTKLDADVGSDQEVADLSAGVDEGNPYRIDHVGNLQLPGIASIALAGLTEEQAEIRLNADPSLRGIKVKVYRLPVRDLTGKDLEPFGYKLFRERDRVLHPDMNTPVPTDYVVGPGDTVRIQLFGNQNANFEVAIDRDGTLNFPNLDQ